MSEIESGERLLVELKERLAQDQPRYTTIIEDIDIELKKELPGDLGQRLTEQRIRVKEQQNAERTLRYKQARDIQRDPSKSLAEVVSALETALDKRLHLGEDDIDTELQGWLDSYGSAEWNDEKVELWLKWVDHHIVELGKIHFEEAHDWLRNLQSEIEIILRNYRSGKYREKLDDLLTEVKEERVKYAQLIDKKNSRDLDKDYVLTIKELQARYQSGGRDDVLKDLREISYEYARYCLTVAYEKFVEATGSQNVEDWSTENRSFSNPALNNPDRIESALRLGWLNLNPLMKNNPDFSGITLMGDRSVAPRPADFNGFENEEKNRALFSSLEKFFPMAVEDALRLRHLWGNGTLDDLNNLYEINRIWKHPAPQRRLTQVRGDRQDAIKREVRLALDTPVYDPIAEGKIKGLIQSLSVSPMYASMLAPDEDVTFVKDEISRLKDRQSEIEDYALRRNKVINLLDAIETTIAIDPSDKSIRSDLDEIRRYFSDINKLEENQRKRFEDYTRTFNKTQTSQTQLDQIRAKYQIAMGAVDNIPSWEDVHMSGQGIYEDINFNDKAQKSGRLLWLAGKVRTFYLRAQKAPLSLSDSGENSRKTLLETARDTLKTLLASASTDEDQTVADQHRALESEIETLIKEVLEFESQYEKDSQALDRVRGYYSAKDFFERDYATAYDELKSANVSGQAMDDFLNTWKTAVEEKLVELADAKEPFTNEQLERLNQHVQNLSQRNHPVRPNLENAFTKNLETRQLEAYRYQQRHTKGQDRKPFGLVFEYETYAKWKTFIDAQKTPDRNELSEVSAYLLLSQHLKHSSDIIQAIHALEEQIGLQGDEASKVLLIDGVLAERSKQLFDNAPNMRPDDRDDELTQIAVLKNDLVNVVKTDQDRAVSELWSYRVAALQGFVSDNISWAIDEAQQLEKVIDAKKSAPETTPTGWLHLRQQETLDFIKTARRRAIARMHSELRAIRDTAGTEPGQMSRWIEYASVLRNIEPEYTALCEKIIKDMKPRLGEIVEHLGKEKIRIIQDDLPASIALAYERMSALGTQIRSIQSGLPDNSENRVKDQSGNPYVEMQNLYDGVKSLANQLNKANEQYIEARNALLKIALNEPGFNDDQPKKWSFTRHDTAFKKLEELLNTIKSDTKLQIRDIRQISELTGLKKDLNTHFDIIINGVNALKGHLSGNLPSQGEQEESPGARYKNAQKELSSIKDARGTIERRLRQAIRERVLYSNAESIEFVIPEMFLQTDDISNLRLRLELDGGRSQQVSRVDTIENIEKVINALLDRANEWEKWINQQVLTINNSRVTRGMLEGWDNYIAACNKILTPVSSKTLDKSEALLGRIFDLIRNPPKSKPAVSIDKLDTLLKEYQSVLDHHRETLSNPPKPGVPPTDIVSFFSQKLGMDNVEDLQDEVSNKIAEDQRMIARLSSSLKVYRQYIEWLDEEITEVDEQISALLNATSWFFGGKQKKQQQELFEQDRQEMQEAKKILSGVLA